MSKEDTNTSWHNPAEKLWFFRHYFAIDGGIKTFLRIFQGGPTVYWDELAFTTATEVIEASHYQILTCVGFTCCF